MTSSATSKINRCRRSPIAAPIGCASSSRATRLPVAAGSAVLIALGIGLGVALWQANEARDQAARATALNTFVLSPDPAGRSQCHRSRPRRPISRCSTAIEERIDKEFKGSPDQLLQLRVTVGDAYENRGETAAARRVFQRAVDEATPHLPKDHLPLLRARVLAADFNLIVSVEKANDLAQTIDILRTKGADGAGTLIDALLIQNMLGRRFHVPERMSLEPYERERPGNARARNPLLRRRQP